jgi:hypothetical protein
MKLVPLEGELQNIFYSMWEKYSNSSEKHYESSHQHANKMATQIKKAFCVLKCHFTMPCPLFNRFLGGSSKKNLTYSPYDAT